ncbi:sugar transferase [uncultured Roseobacter sp.]|uniref:sugar transferase n=1 Tax=uncultured Roseobacter sp. TaxID=114847 RepID=UPI00262AADED|nr:sugar transferase [uncultured Roseobacter sp.]
MTLQFSSHDSEFLHSQEIVDPLPRRFASSGFYRSFVKPLIDLVATLIALPFIVVLVLVAAALIACDGHNPFYSQLRVGRNGRTFRMWKLRTMVHDADERLEAHLAANPAARQEWEQHQKLRNDPRITPIGRILRKTSLDELPQFWNVLTGDMSLVGPRPMMVSQRAHYSGQSYYNLRPGLTGLWQISDRNNCEFSGRVHYDDLYDNMVSMRTDLGVLVRTVGVVLRGTGC